MGARAFPMLFALLCVSLAPAALAAEELIIYSGRSDKFVKPVVEAFTEQTGIEVTLHSAKSTALINKLKLEGDRTPADIFISNDAGNLQVGSDMGLFQAVPDDIAQVIPKNYRAPDNTWIGLSARARVLVVNENASGTDFIGSVFDLADPRLKGELAITNSTNGSFIAGVTVYMLATSKDKTKDWLRGMKANVDGVYNKHSRIVNDVAKGRKNVGLVNHYYIFRHLAKEPDAPIRMLIPDQGPDQMGIAWNVAGVAITKATKKTDAARKLVEFLASEAGQKIFAEVNREYPTRKGVPAAEEVPDADTFKVADVPMYQLGKKRDETLDVIEDVGMP